MTERMPYGKRNWYPHMKPNDVALWERFLVAFPEAYDECAYDVWVGSVPDFAKEPAGPDGGTAEGLYKKKIDVVGFKADQIDLIELKPQAGASAVGQILQYKMLYEKENALEGKTKAVIITDTYNADVAAFAASMGVHMVQV